MSNTFLFITAIVFHVTGTYFLWVGYLDKAMIMFIHGHAMYFMSQPRENKEK